MSWCRFSTICENNLSSDLYIYESCNGGVDLIIASRKRDNEVNAPKVPLWREVWNLDKDDSEEWHKWWHEYSKCNEERKKWLENQEWVNIDLPYAGEMITITSKEELIEFLYKLKELGYNFPEWVFEQAKEWEVEE